VAKFKVLTGDGIFFGFIEISDSQTYRLLSDGQWLVFQPDDVVASDAAVKHPVTVTMSCMSANEPEDPDPYEVAPKAINQHNVFDKEENTNGN